MNELGREVLIGAALRGVRQIRGALWDSLGGRCAQGVLIEAAVKVATPPAWWRAQHRRTMRERKFVGDNNAHAGRRTRFAVPWPGTFRHFKQGATRRA